MDGGISLRGVRVFPGWLDLARQKAVAADIAEVLARAPLVQHETPGGRKLSVRMSAAGAFGWVSDRSGYRYAPHQRDGQPWPPIPPSVLSVWSRLCPKARPPECCLINHYGMASGTSARMGMHVDRDEADFSQPVLSISLGDDALFRVGNATRGGKTESLWLKSGDVAVMAGEARLLHHGVDRIRPGSSTLWPGGGRINLTLRVVT